MKFYRLDRRLSPRLHWIVARCFFAAVIADTINLMLRGALHLGAVVSALKLLGVELSTAEMVVLKRPTSKRRRPNVYTFDASMLATIVSDCP